MSFGVRGPVSLLALGVMLLGSVGGCSKPGEDSEAKRTPIPEPAPHVEIPAEWSIPLEVGSKQVRALDSAALTAHSPDFADTERKAWRLDKLLSDSEFPLGSLVEAIGSDGVGIAMRREDAADAPVPVIVLTRRGEIVAAAIKASDPFPNYHGQGGRLKRPGDPFPRLISPLARLRVSHGGDEQDPKDAPAGIEGLRLQIGENPPNLISPSVLESLPSSTVREGDNKKTVWNVRDVVKASAGENAVLVAVQGEESLKVTAEQWADESMSPVLQVNRRGQLKFQWHEGHGHSDGQISVHSVRLLKLQR